MMARRDVSGDSRASNFEVGPKPHLPWLDDERTAGVSTARTYAGWLVAAALVLIGGAYVVAFRGLDRASDEAPAASSTPLVPATGDEAAQEPAGTISLPPPRAAPAPAPAATAGAASPKQEAPVAQGATAAAPVSRAAAAAKASPNLRDSSPPARAALAKQPVRGSSAVATASGKAPSPGARPGAIFPFTGNAAPSAAAQLPRPGAPSLLNGREVQLGAFSAIAQAKPAWRAMERAYPPLKQFKASLIQNRDSNGQLFYQFELGTASQADSVMLCQSMQRLHFRCAVAAGR